jgi:hypothetical protein
MTPKIADTENSTLDYRLNQLGIRVWAESCQLIAKSGDGWRSIGMARKLPVKAAIGREELQLVIDDPLQVTVYQYIAANPGTDLADVLSQAKPFAEALNEKDAATAKEA